VADLKLEDGQGSETAVTETTVPDSYFGPLPRTLTRP
jgi:hypothetical protein